MKKTYKILKIKQPVAILIFCAILLTLSCVSAGIAKLVMTASNVISESQKPLPYPLQTQPPYIIAIDPGHGNFDTGAGGIVKELKVIDKTAEYLCAILGKDNNFKIVLTRQPSEDPKIAERAQIAIDAKASLLISLHANSEKSAPQAQGFECYPTPPGRLYYDQSLKFAQILVDKMKAEGHKIRGETGIKFAYYSGKSKQMVDSSNTKIRTQKSFGIVEKPLCPAVLVEQCFITSSKDVSAWGSNEGCEKAAQIYYKAICEYFGTTAKE